MTDKKSYFDELVERLRKHETYAGDYMLIGEEDKTIRETVAALERVVRERDEARKEQQAKDASYWSMAEQCANLETDLASLRARLETVEAAITKANDRLPGIETPMMRGDNLAICLCSFFDDGDKETEDDTGWSESARNGYEEVIAAIREHYAASIRNLEPRHD